MSTHAQNAWWWIHVMKVRSEHGLRKMLMGCLCDADAGTSSYGGAACIMSIKWRCFLCGPCFCCWQTAPLQTDVHSVPLTSVVWWCELWWSIARSFRRTSLYLSILPCMRYVRLSLFEQNSSKRTLIFRHPAWKLNDCCQPMARHGKCVQLPLFCSCIRCWNAWNIQKKQ